jgi:hypothetical protein
MQSNVLFPPGSYLVIAKDMLFVSSYPGVSCIVTNFSALNNSTPDAVVIYDMKSNTIDSVMYSPFWGGQNGKSLERIDLEMPSTTATNWGTSLDSLGSTPGKKNSIAKVDYDVMIHHLQQSQSCIGGTIVPLVQVCLRNNGKCVLDSVFIKFFNDSNRDSLPEPYELLKSIIVVQPLAPGDSMLLSEPFPQLTSGAAPMIVVADWWRDENLRNNRSTIVMKLGSIPQSVIINEILFDPLPGQSEWMELFNRSDQPVDLAYWIFHDMRTGSSVNSFEIPSGHSLLKPGKFAVVAADSSILQLYHYLSQPDSAIQISILNRSGGFSFNNDGDVILLNDITGQTIDSVAYSSAWHHPDVADTKGRSLERINPNINSNDPRNWSTCTSMLGGTPGKANSVYTTGVKSSSILSISPNPFSPDGDGQEDFCIIRYTLPLMTSTLNVRIYDIKGRLIRTLANGELAGSHGELVWNGFDDNMQRARIGIYVVFMEATDRSSSKVITTKAAVVVATNL